MRAGALFDSLIHVLSCIQTWMHKKIGEKTYYGQLKIVAVYFNWAECGDWVYILETGALLSAGGDKAQKRY
jgi:hypothetical protein